jgi:hypothetical protein
MNTKPILWDTFDSADRSIVPKLVDVSDPNIAHFYFATPRSGKAVVTAQQSRGDGVTFSDGSIVFPGSTFMGVNPEDFYFTTDGHGFPVLNQQPIDITDFDTSTLIHADGSVPFNADQPMGGNKLINLGTPVNPADAATKDYVDQAKLDVKMTNGVGPTFTNVGSMTFEQQSFYIRTDSTGNPVIAFRGTAGGGSSSGQFGVGIKSQAFSVSNEWQFTHNLGQPSLIWAAYDDQGLAIIPQKVSVHNNATTFFYFSPAVAGTAVVAAGPVLNSITVAETDGTPNEAASVIKFNSNDFYIKNDSTGNPIINLRGGSGGGGGGGSGTIVVRESDNVPNIATATIIFNSNDFYIKAASGNIPTINLRGGASGGGGGSSNVTWSDGVVTKQTAALGFNRNQFYLDGSTPTLDLQQNQTFENVTANQSVTTAALTASGDSQLQTLTVNQYETLPDIATPPAPSTGNMRVYGQATQGNHSSIMAIDKDSSIMDMLRDIVVVVKNTSGGTLTVGQYVYFSGSTGNVANVQLAQANSRATTPARGVMFETVANNGFGRVLIQGQLSGIDLSAYTEGDTLFLSPTIAGAAQNTEPTHPFASQRLGVVLKANANGILLFEPGHADGDDFGTFQNNYIVGPTSATSVILQPNSTAQRTATFPDKSGTLAMLDDVQPGFYGLVVKQTVGGTVFKKDTLVFSANDFYLKANSKGQPVVNSRASSGGSSSVTFTVTDDVHTLPQVGASPKLNFNAGGFYLSQNGSGTPVLNLRYDKDIIPVYFDSPSIQMVALDPFAPYQYVVESVQADCQSGSATLGFYIASFANRTTVRDGRPIGNLDPVTVSTTGNGRLATINNMLNPGDILYMAIYQNSGCKRLRVSLTAKKPS